MCLAGDVIQGKQGRTRHMPFGVFALRAHGQADVILLGIHQLFCFWSCNLAPQESIQGFARLQLKKQKS